MSTENQPPQAYREFIAKYPQLGEAWELLAAAGKEGPLDATTQRLVKFAIAIGAGKEGAAHASVRKARKLGIAREELEQVVALAASTLGLPSAVAANKWIADIYEK
ncbi:MAG: carboxymuconolactone decarboxylase family protein [Leptospiraceae bacterium]|nr:carboxymuconolactone decarboxylase family protein [Leptospiraceae bacterium]